VLLPYANGRVRFDILHFRRERRMACEAGQPELSPSVTAIDVAPFTERSVHDRVWSVVLPVALTSSHLFVCDPCFSSCSLNSFTQKLIKHTGAKSKGDLQRCEDQERGCGDVTSTTKESPAESEKTRKSWKQCRCTYHAHVLTEGNEVGRKRQQRSVSL
jgi:hypothetical protein